MNFMMRKSWIMAAAVVVSMVAHGQESTVERAHFHHVHINAVDPAKSIAFYQKYFNASPVKFRGVADAALVDKSFILFNKVDEAADASLDTAIYHIGWGGVDGIREYEWRKEKGLTFETPGTPLIGQHYFYAYGPDKELIEVWTAFQHFRFSHVHMFADDVNVTAKWYRDHLGLEGAPRDVPKPARAPEDFDFDPSNPAIFQYMWMNAVKTGDVEINIFEKPHAENNVWWAYDPVETLAQTDGRVVDHIAFSYRDIDPVFERMKAAGVEIVKPIAHDEAFDIRSFYVRGPDGLLIEIVEARPIPDGVWE